MSGPSLACGAEKPNIILIYSDDHGWADLGVQGSDKDIRTPNLDALARDGQGWQGRNCTLTVRDGALHIEPEKNAAKPFITRNNLNLGSPVTATLRLRCAGGGSGEFIWRTTEQKDFGEGQSASFKIAATAAWQEVKVELPAKGSIIHVRLAFRGEAMPDVAAIELRGEKATVSSRWPSETKPAQP